MPSLIRPFRTIFPFLRRILPGLFAPARSAVPEALWQQVEARLPFLDFLDAADRKALREMSMSFIERKSFAGAHGFEPDNTVRLSIAMQACLPVLKLGLDSYAGWSGIVVYPGGFVVPRRVMDEDGVEHEYEEEALGEAWDGGPVVLAWFDDPNEYEGASVVIHEFVHKLDMLSGVADGLPPLHAGMREHDWLAAQDAAFEDFCRRVDAGEDTAIDPYAAEHPSEFFAVTSEVFFTDPELLHAEYPRVYEQYRRFFRQNPLQYRPDDG